MIEKNPAESADKREIKRVPPRIIRRPSPQAKTVIEEYTPIDTAKAVAFGASIAEEMKRSAAKAEQDRVDDGIRLSRRPTSRSPRRPSPPC